MRARTYPVQLHLAGKRVLVVGAGHVATRKVERLVECGAEVHVIAREASNVVCELAQQDRLKLSLRNLSRVEPGDITGFSLVIAATDSDVLNAEVAAACRTAQVWVSRVDAPLESDFTLPALARGEHVEATVSTQGTAPSAARRLAKELARWVQAGPDRFALEIARARSALRGQQGAQEKLRQLADGKLFDACVASDEARIAGLMQHTLSSPQGGLA